LAIAVGSRTRYSIRNWNLAKAGPEAKKSGCFGGEGFGGS
jgi:hypothetical protein